MNTIEAINWGTQLLDARKIENPRGDSEQLLSFVTEAPRINLYLDRFELDKKSIDYFKKLSLKRAKRVPLQYLTGSVEFMGFNFLVSKSVLIPRPETEILVEKIIKIVDREYKGRRPCLLDIGTGCGNIAISLTKLRNFSKIKACDISKRAIALALRNKDLNGAGKAVEFCISNVYNNLAKYRNSFDFIVSNPPYLAISAFKHPQKELNFEPRRALCGGVSGINYYRRIIKDAPLFIKKRGGYLIMEIGFDQADSIRGLLNKISANCEVIKDYSGFDRVIVARIIVK